MGVVLVDGKEIEIQPGEKLNGIEVARRAGVEVPHYCWHAGLTVVASCRMCLVESGRVNPQTGKVEMQPKVVPACQTPATDGTVFVTNSEKVKNARAMVEEDLLIRHPIDCPICDKAGECSLQDYHFQHGREERRADIKPFTSRRRELGDTVTLFVDRCVMCTRCVRFTREISGSSELMIANRGAHEEIDIFPGYPLENKMSGCVVDLCPVGALGDKDFLYSQRVWFMKSEDNVCAGCSTGCSIKIEQNQEQIYRLKPRENPHINQWWMCDEGRYGWKHVHSNTRLTEPKAILNGKLSSLEWNQVPEHIHKTLQGITSSAVVVSPHLTVEEAYLLVTYMKSLNNNVQLVLGPVPVEGENETFKNGFTIRAEKCPNRRGVEKILSSLSNGSGFLTWDTFLTQLKSGSLPEAVWIAGGYKTDWNTSETAELFSGVKNLIVQDCFASPLWEKASLQLPGATFAEREGSYVNFNDHLQSFSWGVRPPMGVKSEGQLVWVLSQRKGLYNAQTVLAEIARECPFFAPVLNNAGVCSVAATGVDLRVAQLASST